MLKKVGMWARAIYQMHLCKNRLLDKSKSEQFHITTAQALFLCKRGRPNISPAVAFFTTRVKASTEEDWSKHVRMMQYLHQSRNDV